MRVLVTGGEGFIGSNLVRMLLRERADLEVLNLDNLSYAGSGRNLADLAEHPRYRPVRGDVADARAVEALFATTRPEIVLHLAAESHVDRSIIESAPFLRTNVEGTRVLLEAARRHPPRRFVQVSTDEVYGDLSGLPPADEEALLRPSSPYAASKAAADLLALAYHRTFGVPVVITRSSNNYGPHQFPEKLIPLMVTNALEDQPLPVYGDGLQERDWIHVEDNCRALLLAAEKGKPGEIYNVGGRDGRTNLAVVEAILTALGKPRSLLRHVTDRPGHDRRYALSSARAASALGFMQRIGFAEGLGRTIAWYRENERWWRRLKDRSFEEYYRTQYGAPEAPSGPAAS